MEWAMKNEKATARFDVYTAVLSKIWRCDAGEVIPYASEDHNVVFCRVK
jgi:hypothetical protein